jgi:thiamine biosynthesis lipoprotein
MPKPNQLYQWKFEAIGTKWSIDTQRPISLEIRQTIADRIEAFDVTYSRFRDDSMVSKISRQAGTYIFPDSAVEIFALYQRLYEVTNGKVTPLIGELLENLGYDAQYSFKKKNDAVAVPELDVLHWDGTRLTINEPVLIDIGAVGKGYLVDAIAKILDGDMQHYTIDASGDIRTKGEMNERIGLEDPFEAGKVVGAVPLRNESFCGSATNRRRWAEDLHHIVDPHTSTSTSGVAAAWVKADSTALADGVTTALFFVDPERVRAEFNIEYICLYDNRSMRYSEAMKGCIT